jgi:hypothetical protein
VKVIASDAPAPSTMKDAVDELEDVVIAAQALGEKWRDNGRPYLAMRARELEYQCHDVIDQIDAAAVGWEPTNYVER